MANPLLKHKELAYLTASTHSLSASGKPRTHVDALIASTHSLTWSGSQLHIPSTAKNEPIIVVTDDGQELSVPKVSAIVIWSADTRTHRQYMYM